MNAANVPITPARRPAYAAFLSHCHADKAKVTWLAGVLNSYWVPRKPRRKIFLDANVLIATSLSTGIKNALDDSRYLVVCASESATQSRWVADEVDHFLAKAGRSPEDVLICRVGHAGENQAVVDAWIRQLEARLGRTPGDHLVPDLREGIVPDPLSAALSLLAPMVGMPDKHALLDHRSRFIARVVRGSVAAAMLLLAAAASAWWWLQTPPGAMWNHQRALVAKAPGLKFDYPAIVGPAVFALARTGHPDDARDLARLVKGRAFHDSMTLVIAAAQPSPQRAAVESLMNAKPEDLGAGYPLAALLGFRVLRGEDCWQRARQAYRSQVDSENWVEDLATAGLWPEAQAAWTAWRTTSKTVVEDAYPLFVRMHLLGDQPLSADPSASSVAWLAHLRSKRSVYEAQMLFTEAALQGRLNDSVFRPVLAEVLTITGNVLSEGYDPGRMGQPAIALALLAGLQDEARPLFQATAPVALQPLENDAAEPLAWRALAEHLQGNEEEATRLFANAIQAANAPIEATRTWKEHFAVASALVLAGKWKQATQLPAMIGTEMTRRELELQLIVWWRALEARQATTR